MVNILGIGSPIVDYILQVDHNFLREIPGEKGGMQPISHSDLQKILQLSHQKPFIVAGGSCSNTIKALARFGHQCALAGKIGQDPLAEFYLQSLRQLRIKPHFKLSHLPTAQVICLIDDEGKRTCRSYLGATVEMSSHDLREAEFENVQHVHLEGYGLLNGDLTLKAMQMAKKANCTVSFDLGSFEIADAFRDKLLEWIPKYVDILFSNEDECHAFTKNPHDASFLQLASLCETVVVMLGKEGCWVKNAEQELHQKAFAVPVKDTTGAGDLFASGFLHGYLSNQLLPACAWLGTLTASHVIQHFGAEVPENAWLKIMEELQDKIHVADQKFF